MYRLHTKHQRFPSGSFLTHILPLLRINFKSVGETTTLMKGSHPFYCIVRSYQDNKMQPSKEFKWHRCHDNHIMNG